MMLNKTPLISIVVLNYNGLNDSRECIQSLLKTKYIKTEIIIVDNGSISNDAKRLISEFGTKIKVIRFNKNMGFAQGNNLALKYCKGKYISLLNNDTIVKKNWLKIPIETFENHKKIGVIQPKIKSYYDRNSFDYAGASGGYLDKYGYPFTRGRIFNTKEIDNEQYEKPAEIFWASGAALIFRKSILKKTSGLFDPIFFNYMEEIDFCWRVWKAGYKVIAEPKSVIYHKVASTARKSLIKKRYWEHRNNLLLIYKNSTNKELINIVFPRLGLELINYLYYIFTLNLKSLIALFAAHISFMYYATKISRYKYKVKNTPPVYERSIIFDYFVKKKKYFNKLNWISNRGERSTENSDDYLRPTINQHLAVYKYVYKYCKNKSVLELGSGSGYGSKLISKIANNISSVEHDQSALNYSRIFNYSHNIDYSRHDLEMPFSTHTYGVVFSLQVIEHIRDYEELIYTINRATALGGVAIISTPNKLTQSYNENPYHVREFESDELALMIKKHFQKVNQLGLFGNSRVLNYESNRRVGVIRVMNLDMFRIRKFVPKKMKQIIFELLIPVIRKNIVNNDISSVDYYVDNYKKDCLDLIFLCHK